MKSAADFVGTLFLARDVVLDKGKRRLGTSQCEIMNHPFFAHIGLLKVPI